MQPLSLFFAPAAEIAAAPLKDDLMMSMPTLDFHTPRNFSRAAPFDALRCVPPMMFTRRGAARRSALSVSC